MLDSIARWLERTAFAHWMATSDTGFPWIETIHVICMSTVVGTIAILDLRLLNLAWRQRSVSAVSADVLPITWTAFVLAACTGGMLFTSKAVAYLANVPFRLKMLCMALAGINMLVFHFTAYRGVGGWERGAPPAQARIAAGLSLTFWALVIVFGRWIGFTIR